MRLRILRNIHSGSYLRYAFGEVVLIVLGILLALQIDNWNQTRHDEEALTEYLVKIRSHTLEDIRKLDTISMYRSQMAGQCQQARSLILDQSEDEDLMLLMSCGVAFADYYFKPNTGGYEALKSSGYYGKINNTSLDSLLSRYHSLLDDIAENERSYNEYVIGQEAYLSTQFDLTLILASAFLPQDSLALRATPPSAYAEAFRAYTSSAPYRNVIALAAFQFETMVDQYTQLTTVGQQVIEEIDVLAGAKNR